MKVVINKCHGGFGLSPVAIKRYAKLKKRKCYFFTRVHGSKAGEFCYVPTGPKAALNAFVCLAFDIPDADKYLNRFQENISGRPAAERKFRNDEITKFYQTHYLDARTGSFAGFERYEDFRCDPDLVRVVEELGADANEPLADLTVVTVPDGVEFSIEEYDGIEHVAEVHRTWG